jgi:hypothetical protein
MSEQYTLKELWYDVDDLWMNQVVSKESDYVSVPYSSNIDNYGTKIALWEIPYVAWGDYHNGTVERSNFEYLKSEYALLFDDHILKACYGGYNSQTVYMPYDLYKLSDHEDDIMQWLKDNNHSIELTDEVMLLLDELRLLDNYPVFDEELLYSIEQDIFDESASDWITWEIMKHIDNWYDDHDDLDYVLKLTASELIDEVYKDDQLKNTARTEQDSNNNNKQDMFTLDLLHKFYEDYEVIYEDAVSCYIDIDKLMSKERVKDYCMEIVDQLIYDATKDKVKNFWVK